MSIPVDIPDIKKVGWLDMLFAVSELSTGKSEFKEQKLLEFQCMDFLKHWCEMYACAV